MIKDLSNLKKIFDCFGKNNICICGGLVDYYWIDYDVISDFDLIINVSAIKSFFNISWPTRFPHISPKEIKKHGFDIKRKTSSKFIKKFYQGNFLGTKIDLYLTEDFHKLSRDIVSVEGRKLGVDSLVFIDSIDERKFILKKHLGYEIKDLCEKNWIELKKSKAKEKLFIYNKLYFNSPMVKDT